MERVVYDRLLAVLGEYERLGAEMAKPEVACDPVRYRRLARSRAELDGVVECFRRYQADEKRLEEAEEILRQENDPELLALAEQDKRDLRFALEENERNLKLLLLPRDANDAKNTILEIRAGTGGEEAALFVADLYRMYCRFADRQGWRVELMNSSPTGIGGFKEICFKVSGENVYSQLKFEGGVHRVQRVPVTEAQGRIHTSAVTVAVLPEADEVDVRIDPSEIHFDVFRSSGPGGQSVNTTDSAVRLTHKPTGLVVSCQDEKSQHKNKAKALAVLRARLLAMKQQEDEAQRSAERKTQVGSGDRSERIRTYNFPQDRVTDHRIGLTLHRLDAVMDGEIQELIDALIAADRAAKLANLG